jgi:hypothetical protein
VLSVDQQVRPTRGGSGTAHAHVAVPLIGAVVFGAALYGSIHPTPPGILKWTPYVALA